MSPTVCKYLSWACLVRAAPAAKTLQHTTSKSGTNQNNIVLQRRCYQDGTESFPGRLKLQPTGNILMTNYILRCANSWRTKCRARFNPAPQKDAISEPALPTWAVSQDTNQTFTVRPANVKQTPHYGGNNGDLSGTFQKGITP